MTQGAKEHKNERNKTFKGGRDEMMQGQKAKWVKGCKEQIGVRV